MSTGKGVASSMAQGPAAKVQQQQQQQQQQKVNNPAMPRNIKARAGRGAEFEALPEWKLNCLCADYGIPPTMRGNLHMGGCSF